MFWADVGLRGVPAICAGAVGDANAGSQVHHSAVQPVCRSVANFSDVMYNALQ